MRAKLPGDGRAIRAAPAAGLGNRRSGRHLLDDSHPEFTTDPSGNVSTEASWKLDGMLDVAAIRRRSDRT